MSLDKITGPPNREDLRYEFLDTYANLLYRLGRTKEAIDTEKKALDLAPLDAHKQRFQKTIDKMKKVEPTWPVK